jgi:hypothetical protein
MWIHQWRDGGDLVAPSFLRISRPRGVISLDPQSVGLAL